LLFFLFLSRTITLGGYPLREDLGGDLSGTQLKPGSARDPSPYDVAVTRRARGGRRWCAARGLEEGGGDEKRGSNSTMPEVADPSFLDPLNFG